MLSFDFLLKEIGSVENIYVPDLIRYVRTSEYGDMKLDDKSGELKARGLDILRGANHLTPKIVGYVLIPNGFAEITTVPNLAFTNDFCNYGVTVVINKEKDSNKSKCFVKQEDMLQYVEQLKSF